MLGWLSGRKWIEKKEKKNVERVKKGMSRKWEKIVWRVLFVIFFFFFYGLITSAYISETLQWANGYFETAEIERTLRTMYDEDNILLRIDRIKVP